MYVCVYRCLIYVLDLLIYLVSIYYACGFVIPYFRSAHHSSPFVIIMVLTHACLCACMLSRLKCLTLCDPMDCTSPGFVHGIFQAIILEGVAISRSRGICLILGWNLNLRCSLRWQADSLSLCHLESPFWCSCRLRVDQWELLKVGSSSFSFSPGSYTIVVKYQNYFCIRLSIAIRLFTPSHMSEHCHCMNSCAYLP